MISPPVATYRWEVPACARLVAVFGTARNAPVGIGARPLLLTNSLATCNSSVITAQLLVITGGRLSFPIT
jgi:hypothetical protein